MSVRFLLPLPDVTFALAVVTADRDVVDGEVLRVGVLERVLDGGRRSSFPALLIVASRRCGEQPRADGLAVVVARRRLEVLDGDRDRALVALEVLRRIARRAAPQAASDSAENSRAGGRVASAGAGGLSTLADG